MEDFYINNSSLANSYNCSNITSNSDDNNNAVFIKFVMTCIIICISLPLTLVAIYTLYSQVRNDHIAPIYVINLLISDLIQLVCLIVRVGRHEDQKIYDIIFYMYNCGLIVSISFMVCVALERYLVIAFPLWYRFRRTIKTSVVVCIVVWALPPLYFLAFFFWVGLKVSYIVFGTFLLLPFPLLIFFLCGTLKTLSASLVSPDEKRRIVGILVLVLLIYTLLFLPTIIGFLAEGARNNNTFSNLYGMLLRLNPLADLVLYVFVRKGTIDKLLASVCCCRMDSNDISSS
ncbi:G-protein coupled receptor 4-like isoform X1 [Dicentrarchus labrax]|uniref:G-protein coupled receptors family 1 profile domain-containing protein n=1 Tax=Dicentrarchus labrax TaxID=13489 RepID=A0A8C4E439_DICLA|nr:G-protein coupled receptor 4-like isoform X1 [Dicentrarchus labrax]XP_051236600.1 G-protein coupled receptor 4-like isoform X1 [Dicentrarchus labrax]XP_051236604.1 G-protein coupled receptor 4-like isoform X1 [Dicentrarchus labrax]XP_051236613.1 G-protein coupled receptor 4-like isoform X1 [Dicentrarchus labrax]